MTDRDDDELGPVRTCTGCGEEWPLDREFFYPRGNSWERTCRACRAEARTRADIDRLKARERYHRTIENQRARARERYHRYMQNPEYAERRRMKWAASAARARGTASVAS